MTDQEPDTTPTVEAYGKLNAAYAYFNAALFAGVLPPCLITMQRRNGSYGYFCGGRFDRVTGGDHVDEIALNPAHFHARSPQEVLSTLVHEMVHLWQHHFGKPSRSGYHNREWAAKMEEVGLRSTDTGAEGGKKTGQKMSHMILEEGAFAAGCAALMQGGGCHSLYRDRPR